MHVWSQVQFRGKVCRAVLAWKSRMRRYTAGVTMRHVGSEEEQQPSV